MFLLARTLDTAEQTQREQGDRYNPVEAKTRDLRLARYKERARRKALLSTAVSTILAIAGWACVVYFPISGKNWKVAITMLITLISVVPVFSAIWAITCLGGPSSEEVLATRYRGMREDLDVPEGVDPTKKTKKKKDDGVAAA